MNGIDRDRNPLEFGRVLALSDGIFAIAITLLVISITVPAGLAHDDFRDAIGDLLPKFGIMAVSILVVGSGWVGHHRVFGMLQRIDGPLIALNIVMLGLVAFVPFPHQVLGNYPHEPIAYVIYAVVLGSVNLMATVMDLHVRRRGLMRRALSAEEFHAELLAGLVSVLVFAASIPLAFVLVHLTPVVWLLMFPLYLVGRALLMRRVRVPSEPQGGSDEPAASTETSAPAP
jgi:uncharacterized membrane protein